MDSSSFTCRVLEISTGVFQAWFPCYGELRVTCAGRKGRPWHSCQPFGLSSVGWYSSTQFRGCHTIPATAILSGEHSPLCNNWCQAPAELLSRHVPHASTFLFLTSSTCGDSTSASHVTSLAFISFAFATCFCLYGFLPVGCVFLCAKVVQNSGGVVNMLYRRRDSSARLDTARYVHHQQDRQSLS